MNYYQITNTVQTQYKNCVKYLTPRPVFYDLAPKSVEKKEGPFNMWRIKSAVIEYDINNRGRIYIWLRESTHHVCLLDIPRKPVPVWIMYIHAFEWLSLISNIQASPRVPINNTDAAFIIVYFCPQREYKMCVENSPIMFLVTTVHVQCILHILLTDTLCYIDFNGRLKGVGW